MKFHIVTAFTGDMSQVGAITSAKLREYCIRHGHECSVKNDGFDTDRPLSWSKLKFLMEAIERRMGDYVVWIDADAIILDDEMNMEAVVRNRQSLYIAKDRSGLNCGVFLVEASSYMLEFLTRWYGETAFLNHKWWEQRALMHMLAKDEMGIRNRLAMLEQKKWNARMGALYGESDPEAEVDSSSHILHLPGVGNEARLRVVRAIADDGAGAIKWIRATEGFRRKIKLVEVRLRAMKQAILSSR